MSILEKLLHRNQGNQAPDEAMDTAETVSAKTCPHVVLLPRWDDPNDFGNAARASFYYCEVCDGVFTPAEAAELRTRRGDRLREVVGQ